jgi:hypothetical protein
MMTLIILGSLIGAVFGLRFKVYILIPAVGFALAIAAVEGVARGHGVGQVAITMAIAATSLQVGYIGGSVLGSVLGIAKSTRRATLSTPNSSPTSQPPRD